MITTTEGPAALPYPAGDNLGPLQRPDSVHLVTPAGTLRGDHALVVFEALQRRRT